MDGGARSRTRAIGTGLAAGLAAIFIGGVGLLVLRARLAPPGPAPAPIEAPELQAPPEELGSITGSSIELYDRDNPERLTARILSKRTDPIPERRGMVEMVEPQAWIYPRDGRRLHVRADRGQFYMPDRRREPESGTISGKVVITLYAPVPDGQVFDAAGTEPEGTLRTESLAFDGGNLELSTLDRFEIASRQVAVAGEGITLILNEVKERIELLEIRRGESITVHTGAGSGMVRRPGREPGAPRAPKATPAGGEPKSADAGAPAVPVETFYHVVFNDAVEVMSGERVLRADRLSAWGRLVDNQLPENAIARLSQEPSEKAAARESAPPAAAGAGGPAPGAASVPVRAAAEPNGEAREPVTMRWTGSCVLRPLDAAPSELAEDHLALRATAEKTGLVTFADPGVGGEGHCATLDYGLTTGRLNLEGVGPASVALALGQGDSVEANRVGLDLRTLVGTIPTPGVITSVRADADSPKRGEVSWSEQGRFKLGRDPTGAAILKSASFAGRVRATDGESSIRAEFLEAELSRTPDGATTLARILAEDPAGLEARLREGDSIRAQRLEIQFKPGADPRKPDPTLLVAQGGVEAIGRGGDLRCGYLEADLVRDADGSVDVSAVRIRDGMRFAREEDGVTAAGEEARADASGRVVDVMGEGAFVGVDRARLLGSQIRVNGDRRTVEVFGEWTFEHGEPRKDGGPPIRATGTSGLTFDDATGVAEGAGGVIAVNAPDDLTRDTLEAERVRLEFTPEPSAESPAGGRRPKPGDRRLLRAVAIGGVLENDGGTNATAEALRWTNDPGTEGGRRLVQALRVEAPRLLADDEKGTLDAPGPGKLLVRDLRPEVREGPGEPGTPGAEPQDLRGDTLFTWDGSMHLDRATGATEMNGNTSLTHRSMAYDRVVRLIAERLGATIRSASAASREGSLSDGAGDTELVSASARGAVHATMGPRDPNLPFSREMVADRIEYDAATGVHEATAGEGNLVTLFESARATATSAERIIWNVVKDEVTFVRPQPVVIPR